jgi:hypothetical protein
MGDYYHHDDTKYEYQTSHAYLKVTLLETDENAWHRPSQIM